MLLLRTDWCIFGPSMYERGHVAGRDLMNVLFFVRSDVKLQGLELSRLYRTCEALVKPYTLSLVGI